MGNRQDLDFVSEVLASTVEKQDQTTRLQNGVRLRAEMHQAWGRGEQPDNYRVRWLTASIQAVLDYAQTMGAKLEAEHPEDAASILDLYDILNGAARSVGERLKKS